MFKYLPLIAAIAILSCSQPSAAPLGDAPSAAVPPTPAALPTMTTHHHRPSPPPTRQDADKRSQAEIDVAACTAADGSWRCAMARPKTFGAAGSTPITPASWTIPAWFVSPAAGSDQNTCTTSGSPCQHWSEIAVHRLGFSGVCAAPVIAQDTSVTFLTSQTDNSDPVRWCPISTGGVPTIQGTTASTTTSTTFTRSAQKNRAAGTNSLLVGSFAAGAPAQSVLVQNTTAGKSSRAWVYKTAGGSNWNMSQPFTPQTPPLTNASVPAEVDTWASTDTVNLLSQVAVNLVDFSPQIASFNGGFTNLGQVYNLVVFDPAGAGADPFYTNNSVNMTECAVQRFITLGESNPFDGFSVQNCACLGGIIATSGTGSCVMNGGFVTAAVQFQGSLFLPDGDAILGAGVGFFFGAEHFFGIVYIDATQTFQSGGASFQTLNYGSHVVYGNGTATLNFAKGSIGSMRTGTFASGWTAPALVSPGVQLNGASTGTCNSGADPGGVRCGYGSRRRRYEPRRRIGLESSMSPECIGG